MNIIKKTTGFLKEVKIELTKVSWSTRQELAASTAVVITVTFIMAMFIGAIDIFLSHILRVVFK
ncbi:MAG: preprotein translocase subunit SecE [Candidatus Omnitrophica bacterium]|nr:preprotein translocase subunit SecE [Candidatus Omnitrophota bacterium]MDD5553183.1 preprotein translocase subunit SecE [Candidatus Omnitrophota bacterium]